MSADRATQLLEAGVWLRMTGDHEGARALFEKALAIDPSNARAKKLLEETKPAGPPKPVVPPVQPLPHAPTPPPPLIAPLAPLLSSRPALPEYPLVPPSAPAATPPPVKPSSTVLFGGRSTPLPPPAPSPGAPASQTMVFAGFAGPPPEPRPPPPPGPGQTMLFPSMSAPDAAPRVAAFDRLPPPVPDEATISSAWDEQVPDHPARVIEVPSSEGPDAFEMLEATPAPKRTVAPPKSQRSDVEEELEALLAGVKDLIELDDHTGAMDLLNKAQQLAPQDPRLKEIRARSEQILLTRYESKLGDLNRTPRVRLKQDEIIWLNLDHRAGFVLAQIDGTVTYEDLFAVCGMSRIDTARILAQLVDERVIA